METVTDEQPEIGWADTLFECLDDVLAKDIEASLAEFVRRQWTDSWLIATDFCIDDPNRPNDSFAFVIYPDGYYRGRTVNGLNRLPKRDLKHLREVPPSMVQFLRNGSAFSFCFVVDRERRLFPNAEFMRATLDGLIDAVSQGPQTEGSIEYLKKLRIARQDMTKKSASLKLVENMFLAAILAGYVGFLISKHSMATLVSWIPDRDKITDAYERLADRIYSHSIDSLCRVRGIYRPKLQIFTQSSDDLWCDTFIRPADCIAAAAAWDYPHHDAIPAKIAGLLENVFTDNPNAHFLQISYSYNQQHQLVVDAARVKMLSRPRHHDARMRPDNMTSLRGRSRRPPITPSEA